MPETARPALADPIQFTYDSPMLRPDMTVGAVVAGMSQAGKTTLLEIIKGELTAIDPDRREPLAFPFSNGFRGGTMHMLERAGVDLVESGFLRENFRDDLVAEYAEFAAQNPDELVNLIYGYFVNPPAADRLRNKAVNSSVATLSENVIMHPLIAQAAGRHLNTVVHGPDAPRAVVIDGRSHIEMTGLFDDGGVTLGGLFLVTCSEEFSVRRRLPKDTPEEMIREEIRQQKNRNDADRARQDIALGPTTMPEDLEYVFDLSPADSVLGLYSSGVVLAGQRNAGVHISTDRGGVSETDERLLLPPLLHGMVQGAQILASH